MTEKEIPKWLQDLDAETKRTMGFNLLDDGTGPPKELTYEMDEELINEEQIEKLHLIGPDAAKELPTDTDEKYHVLGEFFPEDE